MAHLVPDDVLDALKCSICYKYLSITPVKVFPNRQTRCGRCSQENDNGTVSLYEKVIENGLFKCINRYEGCNKVFACHEMKLHEAVCVGGVYSCCVCLHYQGSAYDLLQHFLYQHQEKILTKPYFSINLTKEEDCYYLYCTEEIIFIVFVKVDAKKEHVILDCSNIGPQERANRIKTQFCLYKENFLKHKTEQKFCDNTLILQKGFLINYSSLNVVNNETLNVELIFDLRDVQSFLFLPVNLDVENRQKITDLQNQIKILKFENKQLANTKSATITKCSNLCLCKDYSTTNSPKISINNEIKAKYDHKFSVSECGGSIVYKENTKSFTFYVLCSNCEELCSPYWPIYECEACSDFICNHCHTFINMDVCDKGFKLKQNSQITEIFNSLLFYCKWNCGQWFACFTITDHQKVCKNRPHQYCPAVNCRWKGALSNLEGHFVEHPNILFKICNRLNDNVVTNINEILYLYTDNDVIVVVRKAKISILTYKCQVVGILPQLKCKSYRVLLQELKNSQFIFDTIRFHINKGYRIILKENRL